MRFLLKKDDRAYLVAREHTPQNQQIYERKRAILCGLQGIIKRCFIDAPVNIFLVSFGFQLCVLLQVEVVANAWRVAEIIFGSLHL